MNELMQSRFAGVPSLVEPSSKDWFEACLNAVAGHARADDLLTVHASADDSFWPAPDDWRAAYRPYVVIDGVLRIPVKGVLLSGFPWALGSWATGYAYITRALQRGLDDKGVRGIAFVCHTPGGEVAECFELVDKIVAARGVKPLRGFAHEGAYSAGYAVISSCDHVAVSRTGGTGSIGIMTTHMDRSGAMEQAGLKLTYIHAPEGGHKVDGNPTEPLSDGAKKRIQARVNEFYGLFVASVARCRGISEEDVRATKALCFTATESVANGLADSIAPFDDAIAAFHTDLSINDDPEGDKAMNDKTSSEALAAARTEGETAGHAKGKTEGLAEGGKAANVRAQQILDHEEAKGREGMARHLAFGTDMTVDAAVAALKSAPKATAPSRIGSVPDPKLSADDAPDASKDLAASWDAAAAEVNARYGIK